MRGKAETPQDSKQHRRITPAYAGKSSRYIDFERSTQDHPRLCGEKVRELCDTVMTLGSPPPMRGKDTADHFVRHIFGITPAYAGKSFPRPFRGPGSRDHPRLCGEKSLRFRQHLPFRGSPPPMRGKASTFFPISFASRITPAYAGKSPLCQAMFFPQLDHPRLCGEKVKRSRTITA